MYIITTPVAKLDPAVWGILPTDTLESDLKVATAYSIRGASMDGDELIFEPTAYNDPRVFRVTITLEEI